VLGRQTRTGIARDAMKGWNTEAQRHGGKPRGAGWGTRRRGDAEANRRRRKTYGEWFLGWWFSFASSRLRVRSCLRAVVLSWGLDGRRREVSHRVTEAQRKTKGGRDGARGDAKTRRRGGRQEGRVTQRHRGTEENQGGREGSRKDAKTQRNREEDGEWSLVWWFFFAS
jgi:hypothetical protein